MTAKEYLRQCYVIDSKIKRLETRRAEIRAQMYSIGSVMGNADHVQTSPQDDRILRLITRVDKIERDIVREVSRLQDKKQKIMRQIEALEDERYRQVLFYRYIMLMPWEQVAQEMHYESKWIFAIHGQALQAFERTYLT